ncbi:autotransporter domain-containing protein [Oceanicaulis sp. LC35]|uniref:PKD domain-containing protein n=1 Tax=Oceanicaulis sp. LC35 TaxID=3349635 RepID=UPI003F828312
MQRRTNLSGYGARLKEPGLSRLAGLTGAALSVLLGASASAVDVTSKPSSLTYQDVSGYCHVTAAANSFEVFGRNQDTGNLDTFDFAIYNASGLNQVWGSNLSVQDNFTQQLPAETIAITLFSGPAPLYFGIVDTGAASVAGPAGGTVVAGVELDQAAMYAAGGRCRVLANAMDTTAPTVTSIVRRQVENTDADSLTWRVTFSEAVRNLSGADFAVTGATVTSKTFQVISSSVYDITVSGGTLTNLPSGTVGLGFAGGQDIEDLSANALTNTTPTGSNETYNVTNAADTTAPLVKNVFRNNPATATTSSDSLEWRVTFSEDVANVDANDFVVNGTTVAMISYSQVSASEYLIEASGGALVNLPNGTVSLGFAGGQNIADLAGNALTNTTPGSANETYTVTNSAPVNQAPVISSVTASEPTAYFDPNASSANRVSVVLTARYSDADGDTLTASFQRQSGPASTSDSPSVSSTRLRQTFYQPASAGVAVYDATVSDGNGGSDSGQVSVNWVVNTPPTASGPTDQSPAGVLQLGTVLTLSAGAVNDADGQPLTYTWTQTGGPDVTLSDSSAANPTFPAPAGGGSFTFDVVISDGVNSITRTITMTVDVENQPPVAQPDFGSQNGNATGDSSSGDVVVEPGAPVYLDGRSSTDPEGRTLSYVWRQISGTPVQLFDGDKPIAYFLLPEATATPASSAAMGTASASSPQVTPVLSDIVFGLVVSDGELSSAEATLTLDVSTNSRPVPQAGGDRVLHGLDNGDTVQLDATASSDADGDALSYAWSIISGNASLNDATIAQPMLTYHGSNSDGVDDVVELVLVVSDGVFDSAPLALTYTFQDNRAPIANAGANISGIDGGEVVTLNGSASTDPDGDALSYRWTQVSGPTVTLSDANTASPSFTAPDVDANTQLVFELVVSDGSVDSVASQVTVSVRPVGSITILTQSMGGDSSFTYVSSLSALSGSVGTSGGQAMLVADAVGAGRYSVTLQDPRDSGYALTALACTDADSEGSVSSGEAVINLAPGEDVTCTFTVVNSRGAAQEAIQQMQAQRGALLLSNGPSAARRLERVNGAQVRQSGVQVAGLQLMDGQRAPVSLSMTDAASSLAMSLSSLLGESASTGKGSFDLWGELTLAEFDSAGKSGDFSLLYLGADYMVTDRLLVGVLAQIDTFDSSSASTVGDGKGDGFMVGPYATARLADNLYADVRIAWGEADNEINPLGTFVDEFDTSRVLFSGSLTGDYELGGSLSLRPTVEYRSFNETQKAYTDSLGVLIPESELSLNELSFAPMLQTRHQQLDGDVWTAFIEAEGIYNFGDTVVGVFDEDFRVRFEGGVDWASENGFRVSVKAFLDGVGADEFEAHGVRFAVSRTFH